MESLDAQQIIVWAARTFPQTLALACSFGPEDMALLDLFVKFGAQGRVFFLDTGRLHQETYELIERARIRYGIEITAYAPETENLTNLIRLKGPNSFYRSVEDRKECCFIRKVEPLNRALEGMEAWITGRRREQSVTRYTLEKAESDPDHEGLVKLNPLADWTEAQVWQYIAEHEVPYNSLHDRGYRSIGCVPCSRPVHPGENARAGRWWWEPAEQKECGLHERKESGGKAREPKRLAPNAQGRRPRSQIRIPNAECQ